jgi:hypothetical protein
MFAALWGDIMLVRASLFSAYILLVTNMMVRAQMCVGSPVLLSPITSSLTTAVPTITLPPKTVVGVQHPKQPGHHSAPPITAAAATVAGHA